MPQEFWNRPWVTVALDGTLPGANNYLILSGYSVNVTSGVTDINADARSSITVEGSDIVVRGCAGTSISIVSVDGRKIASRIAATEERFTVPRGVYVVIPENSTPVKVKR